MINLKTVLPKYEIELEFKKHKCNSGSDVIDKQHIVYLRTRDDNMSSDLITQLEIDLDCNFEVCDNLHTLVARLAICTNLHPDLILLDSDIFSENATINEVANMISTLIPFILCHHKISFGIIIDSNCTPEFIKDLQKTNITGIIPQVSCLGYDTTLRTVKSLLNHEFSWSKQIIDILTKPPATKNLTAGIQLTPRQHQVLSLVCNRGLSNKKIANVLKISESTVKIHVSAILKAYGVRNRTQLALAATTSLKA